MTATAIDKSWKTKSGFLLATIGCAVGLGNLWRFPFMAGENGGAAFVLVYIGWVVVLGVPLILAELHLGRAGKGNAVSTMASLIKENGAHPFWKIIGYLAALVPFLGLSYYGVVAGWSLDYSFSAFLDSFRGLDAESSNNLFRSLEESSSRSILWFSVFLMLTATIVARGVQKGIERASIWLMPMLFALLIILVGYAIVAADFGRGFTFLFSPDWSKLTPDTVLRALGQAFFSLAIGVGAIITYGAYIRAGDISSSKSAVVIASADTLIALLAGLAIFPVVFASGLEPAGGPGLIFETIPIAFGNMWGGHVFGTLFFVLVVFAALTSTIGMLEPVVSWLEEHFNTSRRKMAYLITFAAWLVGIPSVLSTSLLADWQPLGFIGKFEGYTFFRIIDYLVANILIPLAAFLISVFVGWMLRPEEGKLKYGLRSPIIFRIVDFVVRYLAPGLIIIIFVQSL